MLQLWYSHLSLCVCMCVNPLSFEEWRRAVPRLNIRQTVCIQRLSFYWMMRWSEVWVCEGFGLFLAIFLAIFFTVRIKRHTKLQISLWIIKYTLWQRVTSNGDCSSNGNKAIMSRAVDTVTWSCIVYFYSLIPLSKHCRVIKKQSPATSWTNPSQTDLLNKQQPWGQHHTRKLSCDGCSCVFFSLTTAKPRKETNRLPWGGKSSTWTLKRSG